MIRQTVLLLGIALNQASSQARTVSSDTHGYYVEPHIAGHPSDPNELVVASMVVTDLDPTRWRVSVFWSNNGGERWQPAVLPTRDGRSCSADAWLAWGRERNVYLSCLAAIPSANGRDFNFRIWLHTSFDGGRTWSTPVELSTRPVGEWDHPVLSVAPTRGRVLRDTLFVAGTRPTRAGNAFAVTRYTEGASSFDPLQLYEPPERRNDNFGSAVALAADRVLLTYFAMREQPPRPLFSVLVSDSTSRRSLIGADVMPWGFPMLTRRRRSSGAYEVLATWLVTDSRQSLNVMLGTSTDTGRAWTPAPVTTGGPVRFRARPNVVADSRGAIAVTWFEADGVAPCGDVVLSVRTTDTTPFTEVARVSTTDAACRVASDSALVAVVNRWKAGGDYSGIHSPASGVFDIVWSDVRQNGFHIRFLRTRVAAQR